MKKAFLVLLLSFATLSFADDAADVRQTLNNLALKNYDDEEALLQSLSNSGDMFVAEFVAKWRVGEVFDYEPDGQAPELLVLVSGNYYELVSWEQRALSDEQIEGLSKNRASRKLRRKLGSVTDTIGLSAPSDRVRINAALELGSSQKGQYLPILREKLEVEDKSGVQRALREAINLILLANAQSPEELLGAVKALGDLHSIRAKGAIINIRDKASDSGDEELAETAARAIKQIEDHEEILVHAGSFFRGISTGSVLLIVSFGLAITFGLMGIINMAHGEFIAIGGYTCYVMQNYFASWFGTESPEYQWFFWASIPISFLIAGGLGLILEKGFFRFLYKRPLESLLATWGLSMIMRQFFRYQFGAANVQVANPEILSANVEFAGIAMSEARLFAICFAVFVCLMTWALLNKTNLGLYIRAVMQNRNMASSLGIPVKRVNSLTFAFGCGLAAMAGVILSQITNVGPEMGQAYIVDSFMVVVVGGVGNLLGAGISAMGIGVSDQMLQPIVGPVMGKIVVLFLIILFLQWKPGGLFPTKSRSMDD